MIWKGEKYSKKLKIIRRSQKTSVIICYMQKIKFCNIYWLLVGTMSTCSCLCDMKRTSFLCKMSKTTEENAYCMHFFFLKRAKFSTRTLYKILASHWGSSWQTASSLMWDNLWSEESLCYLTRQPLGPLLETVWFVLPPVGWFGPFCNLSTLFDIGTIHLYK